MNYPWIDKANKIFIGVLIGQFVFGLIIAYFTGAWSLAIFLGGAIMALPLFLISSRPFDPITRHVVAIAVQLATAMHIQQAQGLTEVHFEIFSLLALTFFYRDWKVILSSVLVVAVHHVLFFILQSQSMPFYVFEQDNVYFYILVIHALFAVLEGGVLMYMAQYSHNEAKAGLVISDTVHKILEKENEFNLAVELKSGNTELAEFNRLITSFKDIIRKSSSVSQETYQLASNVADVTESVNAATEQASEQVSLIATAIEEMTVTNADVSQRATDVRSNAETAHESTDEINSLITDSNANISNLKDVISTTADTIQNLSTKCDRIADVMGSITAISEQTNLLALNAAIESARAGEHGRGFAVVADEVRQLATKTRENAEGISEVVSSLIEDANLSVSQMAACIDKVETAVTASDKMSSAMTEVSSGITSVADNITSVATAIEEQVAVSDSISHSTQELHNTSSRQTEEMAQTQNEVARLKQQIASLNEGLTRFKV